MNIRKFFFLWCAVMFAGVSSPLYAEKVTASNLDTVAVAMYEVLFEDGKAGNLEKPIEDRISVDEQKKKCNSLNKYFNILEEVSKYSSSTFQTKDRIVKVLESHLKVKPLQLKKLEKSAKKQPNEENLEWASIVQTNLQELCKILEVTEENIGTYKERWSFNWKAFLTSLYTKAKEYPEKEKERCLERIKKEEVCRNTYCGLEERYFEQRSSAPEVWLEYVECSGTEEEIKTANSLKKYLDGWGVESIKDEDCMYRPWYVAGCFFEFASVGHLQCEGLNEFFPETPNELFGETGFFDRSWLKKNKYHKKIEKGIRMWLKTKFGYTEAELSGMELDDLLEKLQENLDAVRPYHRHIYNKAQAGSKTKEFLERFCD